MRQALDRDRLDERIGEDDLVDRGGGRIPWKAASMSVCSTSRTPGIARRNSAVMTPARPGTSGIAGQEGEQRRLLVISSRSR